ncbi:unnamed protein product [Triticum turgidum subsp. durum]|uniref:F-box domain-containing protein n=1 Tax=Triticum turgidum subsp. durum TaxID=4567 RepID=A0A9R1B729_TRITD|nr:unnamed protein product [Triticum turgidum subsp. durum]
MSTASFRFRRRLPRPPRPALEDDDLLSEILLRLPPQPSSLPRASLVCRRWHSLVSDPAFRRRFRVHHRRGPPLLGFSDDHHRNTFQPALGAPHRLPGGLFSLELHGSYTTLGWRHRLALFFVPVSLQVLVWDPVAGDQHRLPVPPEFRLDLVVDSGAVLRAAAAGDAGDHFQVVLVGSDPKQPTRVLASVYSSETGAWGDFISAPISSETFFFTGKPAVLAGDCLHWSVAAPGSGSRSILKFDLDRQSLAMELLPGDMYTRGSPAFTVTRGEGGRMGFFFLSGFTAQLWSTVTDCDRAEIWEPGRIIELDKLLRLHSKKDPPHMVGYAEENNVVFLWTVVGVFMVHLESLQFKRISKATI